jgi:hypothetical protein
MPRLNIEIEDFKVGKGWRRFIFEARARACVFCCRCCSI